MSNFTNIVSASIVVYNNPFSEIESLIKVLQSVKIKTYIIDNSSLNIIQSYLPSDINIEYIFTGENLGYGKAHNIAVNKSIDNKYKYHIVLNPDIEVNQIVFDELYQFMESNRNTGLSMPDIVYPDQKRQHLCKLLPTPFDLFFRRFIPIRQFKCLHNKVFELRGADYTKSFNVPSLSGCFMYLRISTLEKTGLFDENIFMYCEDIDLSRRIGQISETRFVPTHPVIHQYNKESYRSKKLLKFHINSAIYYFNKWGWFFDRERRKLNKKTLAFVYSKGNCSENKVSFSYSNENNLQFKGAKNVS